MISAGYDPKAMGEMFENMAKYVNCLVIIPRIFINTSNNIIKNKRRF